MSNKGQDMGSCLIRRDVLQSAMVGLQGMCHISKTDVLVFAFTPQWYLSCLSPGGLHAQLQRVLAPVWVCLASWQQNGVANLCDD